MKPEHHFYLTTAIYYANAVPHIGHAYEIIGADVIARSQRLLGKEVFFLTGTDEHGIKVEKTAHKFGMTPKEYVDQIAKGFETTWQELGISYNRFIRTSEPDHHELVTFLWRKLVEKGDIYKASYKGLYCSGCETFLLEKDLNPDGLCQHHLTAPEIVEEENYFFRLSKYRDAIAKHIEDNPDFIQPAFRKNDVINQLEELSDISVSRAQASVSWGIPVPDDPEQVIYVWIDALSNYLTGIGWQKDPELFNVNWPADAQIIGKDILRFHALYWPALLLAADLPLPKTLLVHGFITVSETKISKSIGNVVSVSDLVERFSLPHVDPIRYYMMAVTGFGQDGSYTDEDFKNRVNADLANNLGNLLNRTLNMLLKYNNGVVPNPDDALETLISTEDTERVLSLYNDYAFNEAIQSIMELVDRANKFVNDKEPWALAKAEDKQPLFNVLYAVLEALRQVAILLSPVIPTMAQDMWQQLGYESEIKEAQWPWLEGSWIPEGQETRLGEPLLLRLDSEIVGAGKKQ